MQTKGNACSLATTGLDEYVPTGLQPADIYSPLPPSPFATTTTTSLDFKGCMFGDDGVEEMAELIADCQKLTRLS